MKLAKALPPKSLNLVWIALILAVTLVLSAIALPDSLAILRPDFTVLALIILCWRKPEYVGVGVAFTVGLLSDAMHFIVLGENAFANVVVVYLALLCAKRVSTAGFLIQTFIVFLLLVVNSVISNIINTVLHGSFSIEVLFAPMTGVLLWTAIALSWKSARE